MFAPRLLFELRRIVQVIPAFAVELCTAGEVLGLLVPRPEPRIVHLIARRLHAAIGFVLQTTWRDSQDACVPGASSERPSGQEWANVQANAVVDVWLPTDRLFVQWIPADEQVVGRFAGDDLL